MSYPIPIQNLYYLFCYAWDRMEEGRAVDVGGVESPELVDLFAKVLVDGTHHLLRLGVERSYLPFTEDLSTLRGRISLDQSLRLIAAGAPRLVCEFDELHHDTPANQILKATMARLAATNGIDRKLAHELGLLRKSFREVSEIRLTRAHFRMVRIHRNNAFYRFLLKICELVFDACLPESGGTRYRFVDILRDEKRMALVFQAFVRNFFRIEQKVLTVKPLELRWDVQGGTNAALGLLPKMTTDIHLIGLGRRLIIDTKYSPKLFQSYFEKASFRSEHLYQLFSYVKNAEALGDSYLDVEGVLLYPAVDHEIDEWFEVQGHSLRVATVNLNQDWQRIRADLLSFLARRESNSPAELSPFGRAGVGSSMDGRSG